MGYVYPPAQGNLVGDQYSASRFLQDPRRVQRRLRDLTEQRFIADVLLSGRVEATGGGVLYDVSETIYADRQPESVSPGSEYPLSGITTGAAQLAAIVKWGLAAPITDEAISRQNMDAVDRALLKVGNQIIKSIDSVFLTAIGAAVTQTQAATAAWSSTATATMLLDLNLAKSKIIGQNQGYDADTIVVDDTRYAYLVSNDKLLAGMTREQVTSPTITGVIQWLAGMRILASPNLPAGVTAMILDSRALGSIAYERIQSPGYSGNPATGIESKLIREDRSDAWIVQARRPVAPMIQEPNAACVITGA